jgi:hypothetical protein
MGGGVMCELASLRGVKMYRLGLMLTTTKQSGEYWLPTTRLLRRLKMNNFFEAYTPRNDAI